MTLEEKNQLKQEIIDELLTVRKSPRASTKVSRMIEAHLAEAGYENPVKSRTKDYIQGIIKTCLGIRGMAWLTAEDVPKAMAIANKVFEIIEAEGR